MVIRCRKVKAWMFPFLEGELPESICRDLREHLARCEVCRKEQVRCERALRWLQEGLTQAAGPVPPPPSLPELLACSSPSRQQLPGRRPLVAWAALVAGLMACGLAAGLWGLKSPFLRRPESPFHPSAETVMAPKAGESASKSFHRTGTEISSPAHPMQPRPNRRLAVGKPEPPLQLHRNPQKRPPQPPPPESQRAVPEGAPDTSSEAGEPQHPSPFFVPPLQEPTAALICRAVTWTGEKLVGGVVLLYNARQEVIRRGVTDREGRFAFNRLPGGRYYVGLFTSAIRLTPVELAEGETAETQLEWPRGRISMQLEKAVAGAKAFCVAELPPGLPLSLYRLMDRLKHDPASHSGTNWPWTACVSDEQGRIDLPGVAAGSYTLVIQAPGYAEAVLPVDIADEQPTVTVTVPLEPLFSEVEGEGNATFNGEAGTPARDHVL